MTKEGFVAAGLALTLAACADTNADTKQEPTTVSSSSTAEMVQPTNTPYAFPEQAETVGDCTNKAARYDNTIGPINKTDTTLHIVASEEKPAVVVTDADTPDAKITLAKTEVGIFPLQKVDTPGSVVIGLESSTAFRVQAPTAPIEVYVLCLSDKKKLGKEITRRVQDLKDHQKVPPVTAVRINPTGHMQKVA